MQELYGLQELFFVHGILRIIWCVLQVISLLSIFYIIYILIC